jgi:Zn ribbon nucleic-acid-binding protein
MYLGTRKCPQCRVRRTMIYDEDDFSIRCHACGAEVQPASGILTGTEKARLCAFAVKYQQRTGLRLSPARDLGDVRG